MIAFQFFFFPQDGHSGLEIRGRHIGDQTAFKTGPQTFLQRLNILGWPVTGDDDLLIGRVKGIEGMEEFLLRTLLTDDELHVVDEQYVDVAVFLTEAGHTGGIAHSQGFDQLVGEVLTGDVEHFHIGIFL